MYMSIFGISIVISINNKSVNILLFFLQQIVIFIFVITFISCSGMILQSNCILYTFSI